MVKNDDYTMGVLAHVLGLVSGFVGPLIIYLVGREKEDLNLDNARHALNFQISLAIYLIVSAILALVIVGFIFMAALGIMNLIFCILGAVRASHGEVYKYPLEIPFLKN